MTIHCPVWVALAALLAASGATAAPVITAVAPASGAAGSALEIDGPSIVTGHSYYVFFGVSAVSLTASQDGRLALAAPASLCPASYPVAVFDSGVRSNSLSFTVTGVPTPGCGYACLDLVPDRVVVCPYRPVDPARHDLVFINAGDGRTDAASSADPNGAADPVFDPFFELGWQTLAASVAPGAEHGFVVRRKTTCPTTAPGAGLTCSYGRQTLWLALHWAGDPADPGDDFWIHLNLAPAYGLNSNALAHPSWLHQRLGLVSVLVRPNSEGFPSDPTLYTPQIYGIALNDAGFPSQVAPFAPAQLQRAQCFTGRIQSSVSTNATTCSAGQRLVITRRCYDDPDPSAWTWWNSTSFTSRGNPCVASLPQYQQPILRTYVTELDASCTPTRTFEQMPPVREPPRDDLHRQMGRVPEWGDMEPALSADGASVALTTLTGNPSGDPTNACAGFAYNLQSPADPTSGASARHVHVCQLDPGDLTCAGADDAMTPLGTLLQPPESQLRPGFVRSGNGYSVVLQRQWSQATGTPLWDLVRVDTSTSPNAIVPLGFAPRAAAPEVIPVP